VKGKHGDIATVRRAWDDLRREVAVANRQAAIDRADLSAARALHEQKAAAAEKEIGLLRGMLRDATSEEVERLQALNEKLREELQDRDERVEFVHKVQRRTVKALLDAYQRLGMTRHDAISSMQAVVGGGSAQMVAEGTPAAYGDKGDRRLDLSLAVMETRTSPKSKALRTEIEQTAEPELLPPRKWGW
jgi:chromosome segregation ATPase